MVVTDIIFIAILAAFCLVGVFRGFAKQILGLVSGLVGLVAAFFLLSPVFNFLSGLEFFSALVDKFGASLSIDFAFLAPIAESAGKTQGLLVAEYIVKLVLFIVLAIVLGLVLKLIKKIILAIVALPVINVFDKILGLALGAFWGLLLIFAVFLILGWLKDVSFAANLIETLAPSGSLAEKFILANVETVNEYLGTVWNFIIGKVSAAI